MERKVFDDGFEEVIECEVEKRKPKKEPPQENDSPQAMTFERAFRYLGRVLSGEK